MAKAFEGDLALVETADVLTFVNMGRRTGALELERPDQRSRLLFREGNPIFAATSRPELHLRELLVRLGRVKRKDLKRVTGTAIGTDVGETLVANGILKEEELHSFVKVQVSEIIFDVFHWREGRFAFLDGEVPAAGAVTVEIGLQNLIMEGVRRIDERGRLSEQFPNLDMVAELVANPDQVKRVFTLTPEEWRVIFLVDGCRSLSEICRLVGNPEEVETLKILGQLHAANVITVAPRLPGLEDATDDAKPDVEGTFTGARRDAPVSVEFRPGASRRPQTADTSPFATKTVVAYQESAGRPTVSWLVLADDQTPTAPKAFLLTRDSHTLGRHRKNDIVISDPGVSSFHARIDRTPDGLVFVDLQSRNGCFVNGERVTSTVLKSGDEIRLGATRLRYKIETGPGASRGAVE